MTTSCTISVFKKRYLNTALSELSFVAHGVFYPFKKRDWNLSKI